MKLTPLEFFREVQVELKLVHWPTRKETLHLTYLVIIITAITGLYLGGLDAGFTTLFTNLITR